MLNPNTAIIRIKNLRLRTYIGIKQEEIDNQQDVIVNVIIHYCAENARNSEDIQAALNYRTITKKIISLIEDNRFSLLENLTSQVLSIASDHDWVEYASVEIDKPHALRFADSVSMELCYHKNA
ncbi:dihydroneopterin triphosphate 2'-epimerase [Shewanella intestini]|uniref:Dihydroneopterin triphosphate 2'-epimerase n=1 Tax=Shewanella intestini TaxID=2017544 RepID=A0ABS5I5R0_9GAMM|nr:MULTISPECIES: dihydroneopterin triphosphate 2'-epimerase [Shewanella]MBR9729246.1 dihydroneopterin triphosphate 2'-epimerase [Shewanella intestini]MRG35391.1 dihydroneopterin triphosphate 2'-epimerase [Shewanella sp. XMDDZSB0408]